MERVKSGEVPRACGRDQLGSCWCRKAVSCWQQREEMAVVGEQQERRRERGKETGGKHGKGPASEVLSSRRSRKARPGLW